MRRRFDISETEVLLVCIKMGWSILLLLPIAVLHGPAYMPMSRMAPEWVWGIIGLSICAIVLYGSLKFNQRIQVAGLTLAAAWWALIAATFYVTGSVPTGVVAYGFMSGAALYRVFARMSGYAPLLYVTLEDAQDDIQNVQSGFSEQIRDEAQT